MRKRSRGFYSSGTYEEVTGKCIHVFALPFFSWHFVLCFKSDAMRYDCHTATPCLKCQHVSTSLKKLITRGSPALTICAVSSLARVRSNIFSELRLQQEEVSNLYQEQDSSNPLQGAGPLDALRYVSLCFGQIGTEVRIL